jgi:hypothetical protein
VVGVLLVVAGTSVAATTGVFSPAPASVRNEFAGLDSSGIDVANAVRIGVIDDHAAYAAPTEDGGFCLYFASSPQRSGPSGGSCLAHGEQADGIAFSVSLGHDGGFVFGRVTADRAASVEISVTNGGGTLRTPVVEQGFFLAQLPNRALLALTGVGEPGVTDPPMEDGRPIAGFDPRLIDAITATAKDEHGNALAHARTAGLSDPGMPTETGPAPTSTAS